MDARLVDAATARAKPALVALVTGLAVGLVALAPEPVARAQTPVPSLQVADATLEQLDEDLQFALSFNRALPVADLQPRRGRIVCVVLSPDRSSRRRACVSRRDGRLRATLAPIDETGAAVGIARPLRGARVVVRDAVMTLRAPARALHVTLGDAVSWHAYLQWQDGSGCALVPGPEACTQVVPATGSLTLPTRAARRPAFTRGHRLRLLATGDSMIQIIDGDLKQRLDRRRGTIVRSDAHIGTGITKPSLLDWRRKARGQSSRFKPDVTVMFLGANDGFPLASAGGASARCCDEAWVSAYAQRVEAMMRSYLRGGRSYVYWLTLPAPRPASFARVYSSVNVAIERAAARVGGGVRVVDLAQVFTPGGRFRQTIAFRGQTIDARQPDGIHLSPAGASVAATLVVDRLHADHALP
jgi:lysophospholipase L1-like esterase